MDKEKPRRWWARLTDGKTIRIVLAVGWMLTAYHYDDVFQSAVSIDDKLEVISHGVNGCLLLGVCLFVYLDSLLNELREQRQPKSLKDFSE